VSPVPQSRPPRPAEAAARFCLSCAGTVACWGVWIVLVIGLGLQLYALIARELPLPPFIVARLESRLAEENLAATFAHAQFDPSGGLYLRSVRLRVRHHADPLVLADGVFVRKSPWSILSGARAPDEIRLDGATLQLPAPLSPSGAPEPLLRQATATLRLEGSLVHVDQLAFRLGRLAVTMRGDFQLPPRAGERRPPLGEVIAQVLQIGRRVARELPRLDCLERPVLHATLGVRAGIGNVAELELTADAVRQPAGLDLETGPLRATAIVRLDGTDERPLRVAFATPALRFRDQVHAANLAGAIATTFRPRAWALPESAEVLLSAARVQALDEVAVAPTLTARWLRHAPTEFDLGVTLHDQPLAVAGRFDPRRRTGRVTLEGPIPPSLVTAVLARRAARVEPYLRFADPVRTFATATFGPDGFELLRARVDGARLNSNGVHIAHFRGRVDLDRKLDFRAEADHVQTAGGGHAQGIYWMNFRRMDFRVLLTGGLNPPEIAGWFRTNWWLNFWENIRFPGALPVADVDVQGNYRDSTNTNYFGSTDAAPAIVLGADFETAKARVFVRPHFAHAFDLTVARADGAQRARGWFKRSADARTRELRAYEFDLTGNLDPGTLRHLGGPAAASLLEPWNFSQPPQLALRGRTSFRDGRAHPDLTFRGEAGGGVTFEKFPLETVSATGGVSGNDIRLDRIELAVAGGHGTAKAAVTGEGERKRLGFDFYLEGADLVRTIRTINEFETARAPAGEPPASPNRDLLKRASGGRLNFALSAQGHPGDLTSFNGSGNVEVAGAELGEVHLFGLLSQLLSGLSLNFSSLKLDTLRGSYRVADGRVNFPDIRVTGPTALIEGRGDYRLTDKTLDFTARFKPYEENRNLLTGVIGIVMNPLASILELRLTGPIGKPDWSVSLGSSTPRETPLPEQRGSAGAADLPPANGGAPASSAPPPASVPEAKRP
jgi:hypothetical protein